MSAPNYQTVDEVTEKLAELLPSSDPRRAAWIADGADEDDQLIACVQATMKLDALRYEGIPEDCDQLTAWPRLDRPCGRQIGPVADVGTETVAGLPVNLRAAHAIQAAAEHFANLTGQGGAIAAAEIEASIAAGLVSQSVKGRSESYDPRRAADAWNQVEPEVRRLLARYRLVGGGTA